MPRDNLLCGDLRAKLPMMAARWRLVAHTSRGLAKASRLRELFLTRSMVLQFTLSEKDCLRETRALLIPNATEKASLKATAVDSNQFVRRFSQFSRASFEST